MTVSRMGE